MFPSWQETMVELHRAESVEQLWMVLVTPHGIHGSAMWEEPYGLFRRFHENDSENAEMTAALLWHGSPVASGNSPADRPLDAIGAPVGHRPGPDGPMVPRGRPGGDRRARCR